MVETLESVVCVCVCVCVFSFLRDSIGEFGLCSLCGSSHKEGDPNIDPHMLR